MNWNLNVQDDALKIAIFAPEESEQDFIDSLGSIRNTETEIYNSAGGDVIEQIASTPPDAVLLPLRLSDSTSGVSICLRLRSHESMRFVPIIGFSQSHEKSVLQAFYDVGADCILSPPLQAEQLILQIRALKQRFQEFQELSRIAKEKGSVSSTLQEALDLSRDAIFLFDLRSEPYYMNSRASDLLGLEKLSDDDAFNLVRDRVIRYIEEHKDRPDGDRTESAIESTIHRADGRGFFAGIRVKTLFTHEGVPCSYAISVNDLSELDQLSATLGQALRTRSFGLLAASGSMQLLDLHGKTSLTPLIAIEKMIDESPRSTPLNATLTALLEFLDLVISPSVVVKVSVKTDYTIGMRSADFFQMLGHLILYAVEYAGPSGEVFISFDPFEPGEGIPITFHAKSKKVTPFVKNDYLSALVQGQLLDIGSGKPVANKLASGLIAAENIANKYRSGVQYRSPSEGEMKLRVVVPIDQRSLQKNKK